MVTVTGTDGQVTGVDGHLTVTLAEAVVATGTSESTIRRRIRQGRFPGAVRDPRDGWRVPLVDLRADGLTVAEAVVAAAAGPVPAAPVPPAGETRDEVIDLRAELATERARRTAADERAAQAQALAAAQTEVVADLRERVGRAEATAEARDVEVRRLLHVVDRLTRAVGAVPDDEDVPRVVQVVEGPQVEDEPDDEPQDVIPEDFAPAVDEPGPAPAPPVRPRRRWWPWGR